MASWELWAAGLWREPTAAPMGASRYHESHPRERSPQPHVSSTHLSTGLCEVHFAFPANPTFSFSAMSRGNTIGKSEIPQLSSPAQPGPWSTAEMATQARFPTASHVGGDGRAWGSKRSCTANPATRRSVLHRFSPELPVTFSPFWLSPSLTPVGDTGQAGRLPSPSLLGETERERLLQEGRGSLARTPQVLPVLGR